MRWEEFDCEDCGATGVDPGSLHEPEACLHCLGHKRVLMQTDPLSVGYASRKPMGRGRYSMQQFDVVRDAENKWRFGQ